MITNSAHTIPYQLRPHKAIERNLFISALKKIDRYSNIDLDKYRYVGFGAPFLEDFKIMHLEFGIHNMDCIEYNPHAFSRQKFNNPYSFVNLYNLSSTEYISGVELKRDKNQIIWLDYAAPGEIRQQLRDIEMLSENLDHLDILKFTFNANPSSFANSHQLKRNRYIDYKAIINLIKNDPVYNDYYPTHFKQNDLVNDFSSLLRAMAIRAVERGLSKNTNNLEFKHLVSFSYADGQLMTTITGVIFNPNENFTQFILETGIQTWEFYQPNATDEIIIAHFIQVPAMTIAERITIDKLIPPSNIKDSVKKIAFKYGSDDNENVNLLEGYFKYYKYLPYYSKVTY